MLPASVLGLNPLHDKTVLQTCFGALALYKITRSSCNTGRLSLGLPCLHGIYSLIP